MDRLNKVHRAARVDLPSSVVTFNDLETAPLRPLRSRRPLPIVPRYVGIVGFLACGAAVVATAGYLAFSIQ